MALTNAQRCELAVAYLEQCGARARVRDDGLGLVISIDGVEQPGAILRGAVGPTVDEIAAALRAAGLLDEKEAN